MTELFVVIGKIIVDDKAESSQKTFERTDRVTSLPLPSMNMFLRSFQQLLEQCDSS